MTIDALANLKTLHHAYRIAGSRSAIRVALHTALQKRGVLVRGNPDVQEYETSEFSVEDARAVSAFASLKPIGTTKYIILSFSRATTEAQNALLKVVEEAPGNSVFFFIVENRGQLVATIQSRTVELIGIREEDKDALQDAATFLNASFEARLALVEKMTSVITKTQDRAPVRAFLGALLGKVRAARLPAHSLRDILDAERYMRMQGGSAKAALSHLAVSLPISKK